MSGCLDKVQCSCDWFEPVKEWFRPKRNMMASIIAGTLVSDEEVVLLFLSKTSPLLSWWIFVGLLIRLLKSVVDLLYM